MASTPQHGTDPIVSWLEKNGLEVNLENWLAIAFPEGPPPDLSPEDIPEEVRTPPEARSAPAAPPTKGLLN